MRPSSRRRRDRPALLLVATLVLASCAFSSRATTTTSTTIAVDDSTVTSTTAAVDSAGPTDPPCAAGSQPFVENGGAGIIERADSDADIVAGVRWEDYATCVRVVVEFAAPSGAPAVSPPGVGPLFIRSAGVLRLQLDPTVSRSAILEQVLDTPLVDTAFVVRRVTEDLFIDLHLGDPAVVRVSVASGPARVVVDVMEGGDQYRSPAIITEDLVVIDPVGGTVLYPFTVNGYVRNGPEPMTVTVEAAGTEVTAEGGVGTRADTWGAFTVLFPDGPDGGGSLIVGGRIPISVDLS